MHRRLVLALSSALFGQQAAAADDATVVSPSFRVPPAGALVVLLPHKMADADLQPGARMMLEQLHRQLAAAGYRVALLDEANHDLLWQQEVEAVGGVFDPVSGGMRTVQYGKALAAMAQRIAADTQCSLVLRARLLTRRARFSGFKAEWDGQARQSPVSGGFAGATRFDGHTVALSVELVGLAPDGTMVFRTLGGTSLPYRSDMQRGRVELRSDLFASDQETAEGVQIALKPLRR